MKLHILENNFISAHIGGSCTFYNDLNINKLDSFYHIGEIPINSNKIIMGESDKATQKSAAKANKTLYRDSLVLKAGVTLGKLVSTAESDEEFYYTGTGMLDIRDSTLGAKAIAGRDIASDGGEIIGGGNLAISKIGTRLRY